MFTVLNRDVIPQICSILLFFFIFDYSLYARGDNNSYKTGNDRSGDIMSYNSYENYLPRRSNPEDEQNPTTRKTPRYKLRQKHDKKKTAENPSLKQKATTRYTVRTGDTLFSIAKKYGVTISSLEALNSISNKGIIKKGMVLKIPTGGKQLLHSQKTAGTARHASNLKKKPRFKWPLKNIITYKQDEIHGVKPIGIIITGKAGSRVITAAPGVVRKIGRMRGFGNYIVIHHAGRYATVYANVTDITVSVGDMLTDGRVIATINPENRNLHFQIDLEGKPENPLNYLPKKM